MSKSLDHTDEQLWNAPLGGLARSIISCPEAFELVVEGVPLTDPGILHGIGSTGVIRLLSTTDGELARCARLEPPALMYVDSALTGWEGHSLAIVGELHYLGEIHQHPDPESAGLDPSQVVDLTPSRVMLMGPLGEPTSWASAPAGLTHELRAEAEVPLADFRSRTHEMNAGYLQRAAEHANACHQQDLRRTVAVSLGRPITEIAGVEIHHINNQSAYVDWLDNAGSTRHILQFPRPASTPDDLAGLLIEQLKLIGTS